MDGGSNERYPVSRYKDGEGDRKEKNLRSRTLARGKERASSRKKECAKLSSATRRDKHDFSGPRRRDLQFGQRVHSSKRPLIAYSAIMARQSHKSYATYKMLNRDKGRPFIDLIRRGAPFPNFQKLSTKRPLSDLPLRAAFSPKSSLTHRALFTPKSLSPPSWSPSSPSCYDESLTEKRRSGQA